MTRGSETRAFAAAALTGVQVGAGMVATRFVVDQLGPASLALLRYAIGFLCLLPLVLINARVRFDRRDLVRMMALGVLQFAILITLLNYGLKYIPSARAALLFTLFPLLTMLLAAAQGSERLSAAKTTGVMLAIVGVAVALGGKLRHGGAADEWIGAAAVLASALCGAVCAILYRPYLRKYPALPVGAWAMLASVVALAAVAPSEGLLDDLAAVTAIGWAAILFIGVTSGIGYFLWLWALANTTPTRVTVFLALSPVTALILGAVLLAEPITVEAIAGLVLVSGGLWCALRPDARE